jgi:CDP-diacylglycerol--serine O-phosphatidyltransferase
MSADVKKRRPRKRRWRKWKDRDLHRGTYIVPNLFTTANLLSGFFGIINSIDGKFEMAAFAILVSCVFDILDGKVARLTRATSRFGVEYDSMADLVAFGVGPGILLYLWALRSFGRLGWLAAFVFVACGALRLARFNVQTGTVDKNYFVGLPIPGAALMVSTSVLFLHGWRLISTDTHNVPLLCATYLLGFLMVSTVPYKSFKDFEVVKAKPLPVLFAVIVSLTIIAFKPGLILFLMVLTYVTSGPVIYLNRLRHRRDLPEEGPKDSGSAEEQALIQTMAENHSDLRNGND